MYLGNQPTAVPLTSADLEDNIITTAKIADANVTNPKLSSGSQQNFRNIIINGDMSIAQRGTSASAIPTFGYFTCDRWWTQRVDAGSWTQSQSTDVPTGQGFVNSFKMECTTANASLSTNSVFFHQQKIEGQNLQYLKKGTANAESVTLSFWVKSNKTGTYIIELKDQDNSRNINKSYTIDASNTWEKKTLTFAGDTTGAFDNDNENSLRVYWWFAAGTDYTSGTLATSWENTVNANRAIGQVNLADTVGNYINITGVQLEAGTTASDFEFLPYDVNINRCYRYYQKSYEYGTSVGTSTQIGFRSTSGHQGGTSTAYIEGDIQFLKIMRASPTLTFYDHNGNSGKCARLATGVARYANENIATSNLSPRGVHIYSTSGTAAGIIQIHFVAEAEL